MKRINDRIRQTNSSLLLQCAHKPALIQLVRIKFKGTQSHLRVPLVIEKHVPFCVVHRTNTRGYNRDCSSPVDQYVVLVFGSILHIGVQH